MTSAKPIQYVNVVIKAIPDSTFVAGTVTDETGRYTINGIAPGEYVLTTSFVGYQSIVRPLLVGRLSEFLDLGNIEIAESATALQEVVISGQQDAVAETMDKKHSPSQTTSISQEVRYSRLCKIFPELP